MPIKSIIVDDEPKSRINLRQLLGEYCRQVEIVGEAAYLLTKEFKLRHPLIEWEDMIGMRHILVHGYYQIKDEIIWATIETELQPLKESILLLLADF